MTNQTKITNTKAVFLDRDGTLIEHYNYLTDPSQVKLFPWTVSALKLLSQNGFALVVVSNQSAVARGMLTEKKLVEIHSQLQSLLAAQGVLLDKIYYCPFHPEGVLKKYQRNSNLRKPNPGMLLQAEREMNIDLNQSWMVGDDDRDVAAGRSAGCRTVLLNSTWRNFEYRKASTPDYETKTLQEAANLIISN